MVDKNGDGIPDMEIEINGVKRRTKDIFPEAAARQDFHTRLKLLDSPASGEPDGMPDDGEALADSLFKGTGKKVKLIGADGKER